MQIDHIDPDAPGTYENLQWLCTECNRMKDTHTPASAMRQAIFLCRGWYNARAMLDSFKPQEPQDEPQGHN